MEKPVEFEMFDRLALHHAIIRDTMLQMFADDSGWVTETKYFHWENKTYPTTNWTKERTIVTDPQLPAVVIQIGRYHHEGPVRTNDGGEITLMEVGSSFQTSMNYLCDDVSAVDGMIEHITREFDEDDWWEVERQKRTA
jgi:hypothetical protein